MGYSFSFDVDNRIVYIKRYGTIEVSELFKSVKELLSRDEFKHIDMIMTDMSEADFSRLSAHDIKRLGEYVKNSVKNKRLHVALIAPSDFVFGLSRMFEMFTDIDTLMVFRNREEAANWLKNNSCLENNPPLL